MYRVGLFVLQGFGGAEGGAGRVVVAAEVAFDGDSAGGFVDHVAEGAGDRAEAAADAAVAVDFDRGGFFVAGQGLDRADADAGSVVALEAGEDLVFAFAEHEGADARDAQAAGAGVFEGAGQFAGSAGSAERRIDGEGFMHVCFLLNARPRRSGRG